MQKPLQRRHMLALIGQRQREELLDRIARLGAEPLQDRAAAAAGAKDLGVELEWRHVIGAGAQFRQSLRGRVHDEVAPGTFAQPVPQLLPLAAAMGDLKQLLF